MTPRLAVLIALLAAPLPARAADAARAALDRLLDLEQSIPRGGLEGQAKWETDFRLKTTETMKPLAAELKKHGLDVRRVPASWLKKRAKGDFSWSGAAEWRADFEALPEGERCGRVVLAYAFGIWQITGLTAEQPVNELNDLLVRDYTDMDALWRDRARAAWAMRHVHALAEAAVPAACADLVKEGETRWNFIFDSDKRPTGLARYMCGRPMNSHWADDDIDAKKKPEPRGWTKPVD